VKAAYIEEVVSQIVEKDIRARKKVRNVSTFDRVMTYVINKFVGGLHQGDGLRVAPRPALACSKDRQTHEPIGRKASIRAEFPLQGPSHIYVYGRDCGSASL
jgi:hypothetical protein